MSEKLSFEEIINHCSDWDEKAIIQILLQYIRNQDSEEAFMDHMVRAAHEDCYLLPGEDDSVLEKV